jgi:hypothetical protein
MWMALSRPSSALALPGINAQPHFFQGRSANVDGPFKAVLPMWMALSRPSSALALPGINAQPHFFQSRSANVDGPFKAVFCA